MSIFDAFYGRVWNLWRVKRAFQLADLCFFLNRSEEHLAIKEFKLKSENVRLAPNGLPPYLLSVPRPISNAPQGIGIAQIGTFKEAKGHFQSIAALTQIMANDNRVFFKLLGTECGDNDILSFFPVELRNRVQNIPNFERQQLPTLLEDCDITLFPSLTEGFGMALLESMACHLAPVASASAGPSDIITSPNEGLLVPVGDTAALQDAITRLLRDRSLRETIRHGAFRRAQEFPWASLVEARVRTYLEFLDRRSLRSRLRADTNCEFGDSA